jgi:hypothetical protein
MPKAELMQELQKLGVRAAATLDDMRKQYHDLLNPHLGVRRLEYERIDKEAELEAQKSACCVCKVSGSYEKQSTMLLRFDLASGDTLRMHERCGKEDGLILSSTEAKSFMGPTTFKKCDGTPGLPAVIPLCHHRYLLILLLSFSVPRSASLLSFLPANEIH